MERIDTPEEFVKRLPWMSVNDEPDLKQWANHICFRDAAIRAESAALLKMCGDKIEQALREVKAIETYDAACTLTEALAALRETGVYNG